MKKRIITTAIILGLAMTSFADPNGSGLFQRGDTPAYSERNANSGTPILPVHGLSNNQNATVPLGTGVAILASLGAAYFVGKKRKEKQVIK